MTAPSFVQRVASLRAEAAHLRAQLADNLTPAGRAWHTYFDAVSACLLHAGEVLERDLEADAQHHALEARSQQVPVRRSVQR